MASTTSPAPDEVVPDAPALGPLTEMAKAYRAGLEEKSKKSGKSDDEKLSPHADRPAPDGGFDRSAIEEALAGGAPRYNAEDDKSAKPAAKASKPEEPKVVVKNDDPDAKPASPIKK